MMISPNWYYEEHIKGKSVEEIKREIRSLKRGIKKLKDVCENRFVERATFCPSEEVRIACFYEYLEEAKKELDRLGSPYQPTKAELKGIDFENNIEKIKEIHLKIRGFFYGDTKYLVKWNGDRVIREIVDISFPPSEIVPLIDEEDVIIEKQDFIDALRRLRIGDWDAYYHPERFGVSVLDGTEWELQVVYDGHKTIKKYGSNVYPYNFKALMDLIGISNEEE
jgi:hypothetical protein